MVLLSVAFLLAGILLLGFVHHRRRSLETNSKTPGPISDLLLHVGKDVGIAAVVSGFVALPFELYLHHEAESEHKRHVADLKQENESHIGKLGEENQKQVKATEAQHTRHLAELQKLHDRDRISLAKDVTLETLGGYTIDDSLREELRSTIFETKLIRKDLKVAYEFLGPGPDQPKLPDNLIRYRVTVSYTLHNPSQQEQKDDVVPYFHEVMPYNQNEGRFVLFEVKSGAKPVSLRGESITVKDGTKRVLKLQQDDGVRLGPKESVGVIYTYETAGRIQDRTYFVSRLPASGIRLEVKTGPGVPDLRFSADSLHRAPPKPVDPNAAEPREWVLTQGILPSQGVVLYWFPKNDSRQ